MNGTTMPFAYDRIETEQIKLTTEHMKMINKPWLRNHRKQEQGQRTLLFLTYPWRD